MICTTDRAVATARNEAMLANRQNDSPPNDAPPMAALTPGPLVAEGCGGQSLQVDIEGRRSDDIIGPRFAVVSRRFELLDGDAARD
jgi:hypothetical protein